MPAGGICPQCRADVSPVARFCGKCGVDLASPTIARAWSATKVLGWVVAMAFIALMILGIGYFTVGHVVTSAQQAQVVDQTASNDLAAEAQRDAIRHKNDAWWDPSQPDHLKAVYYGREYWVQPTGWTSIDIRMPFTGSSQYQYEVVLEGLSHFRARPNGEARMEYTYPDAGDGRPARMANGYFNTLLVQPTDGMGHWVRVKYVRVARGG